MERKGEGRGGRCVNVREAVVWWGYGKEGGCEEDREVRGGECEGIQWEECKEDGMVGEIRVCSQIQREI